MRFPKFWEHRNAAPSGSYTTDVLNFLSANVSGQALRGTAAAIEICAGVWQRGMATAEVTPMNGRTAALTPSVLGHIGRYLLRYGEVLFEIGVGLRGITLTPAQHWTVTGGIDPDSWMVRVHLSVPFHLCHQDASSGTSSAPDVCTVTQSALGGHRTVIFGRVDTGAGGPDRECVGGGGGHT